MTANCRGRRFFFKSCIFKQGQDHICACVCCLSDEFIPVSELVRVLLMMLCSLTLWYRVILLAAAA